MFREWHDSQRGHQEAGGRKKGVQEGEKTLTSWGRDLARRGCNVRMGVTECNNRTWAGRGQKRLSEPQALNNTGCKVFV